PAEAPQPSVTTGSNGQERVGAAEVPVPSGRVKSTPLARKIAAEANVEIARVPGSGPGGRVTRQDVESYLQKHPVSTAAASPATATAPAAAPPVAPAPRVRPTAPTGKPQRIPHTPMRRTIAKRMAESKQSAPEIHVTVDVRLDKLMAVRES